MKVMGRLNRNKDCSDIQYHIEFDTKPDVVILRVDMGLNTDPQNGLKKKHLETDRIFGQMLIGYRISGRMRVRGMFKRSKLG